MAEFSLTHGQTLLLFHARLLVVCFTKYTLIRSLLPINHAIRSFCTIIAVALER